MVVSGVRHLIADDLEGEWVDLAVEWFCALIVAWR